MNRYYKITDGVKTEIVTEWFVKHKIPHILLAYQWKIESVVFINPQGKRIQINIFDTDEYIEAKKDSELLK